MDFFFLLLLGGSQLSIHSTATINISKSFSDGSINLTNTWTRQLSETSSGNVCSSLFMVLNFDLSKSSFFHEF